MGVRKLSASQSSTGKLPPNKLPASKLPASNLVNRNVIAGRGRTSMRLEPELWEAMAEICRMEQIGLSEMIRTIESRGHPGGRTSAVRVFIVQYFRGIVAGRQGRDNASRRGDGDYSPSSLRSSLVG